MKILKFEEVYETVSRSGLDITIWSNGIIPKERTEYLSKQTNTTNIQINVQHPDKPDVPQKISHSMITDDPELPNSSGKDVVLFGKGQFDRSPCGTGTSSRISVLYSKGLLNINEEFIHESIINTQFKARILETTKVGSYEAIIPEITGRAFVTQISQLIINPDDPLKNGFTLL